MTAGAAMPKKWLFVPLALAALTAGAWLAHSRQAAQAPLSALWQSSFPDLTGKPQPLAQWRGQVLVLNFWATWCAPCREEMPDFAALRAQYHGRGVEFVGLAIDNPANVGRFLQTLPVGYPILIGEGAAHGLTRALGNPAGALPYTIVIDRNGNIALAHLGRLPRGTLDSTLRKIGA